MNDRAAAAPLLVIHDDLPWWPDLAAGLAQNGQAAAASWGRALRALIASGTRDPFTGLADAAAYGRAPAWDRAGSASGVRAALLHDVTMVVATLAQAAVPPSGAPAATELAPEDALGPGPVRDWSELLKRIAASEGADQREGALADWLGEVIAFRQQQGGGPLARAHAWRWDGEQLQRVERPSLPPLDALHGLDDQIRSLRTNVEAFLAGRPAMHALLYGPRGSGKSTVVRGLLDAYREQGLRLVEIQNRRLHDLPQVLATLRGRPERYLAFVDDLAFEAGDVRYQTLKSLLEGTTLDARDTVRLVATSNRRHLVQERLRDRPDPLDDDVHAWDTHQERLALADRFGLVVTFPSADKRRYLLIVRHLAGRNGLETRDLEARADRFARSGNGYSGRTAQQFVDSLRAGLA